MKVIGITGSYGKTSVKNILSTILSSKFKICPTPASYNTPLGLAKTILSNLREDDEIFIAEMGAKQVGDITELCDMVCPEIGIITGIGNQHFLTFGNIDNIVKTKSELAEFVSKLSKIRTSNKTLAYGDFRNINITNHQYVFERKHDNKTIIVMMKITVQIQLKY